MSYGYWLPALLGSLWLVSCGDEPEPEPKEVVRPVKVMTLEAASGPLQRKFPGRVRAAERLEMAFQIGGKLVELNAKQGENVVKDAVLARLDQRDFRSNLKAARARFEETQANFKRAQELVKDGFLSRTDYDRVKANYDTAAAELDKAKKALEDTTLIAPFSGLVARRYVENFQEIAPGEPILSLQDVSTLEIVVDAPERLIAMRRQEGLSSAPELEIVAQFDAVPGREFPLSIKEFATVADPKTQTYEYVAVMPRPDPEEANILPGMTATVSATRSGGSVDSGHVFVIPALAVFADASGQSQVWIIDPQTNTAHARPIQTGTLTGTEDIEIVTGLKPGEIIAIAGVSQIREGMKVRPVTEVDY